MSDTTTLLDGPRLAPLAGNPPTGLVVLLHGFAASGHQLIPLGLNLETWLPNVAFAAPNGPVTFFRPSLRAWAPIDLPVREEQLWEGLVAAAPVVDRFIDHERDRLGLTDAQVALVGFSQGAMVALHVGLRRQAPPAAIVSYSGEVVGHDHLSEITSRPPVTLIHGERDPVVPFDSMRLSADALRAAGVEVETVAIPGLGHTIDETGREAGAHALSLAFGTNA